VHYVTEAAKSPKEFHIFHERHVWKSPSTYKRCSPAKDSVVAASYPKQKTRVVREAIRQSVYSWRGRQTDPKETTTNFWIAHNAVNLI